MHFCVVAGARSCDRVCRPLFEFNVFVLLITAHQTTRQVNVNLYMSSTVPNNVQQYEHAIDFRNTYHHTHVATNPAYNIQFRIKRQQN